MVIATISQNSSEVSFDVEVNFDQNEGTWTHLRKIPKKSAQFLFKNETLSEFSGFPHEKGCLLRVSLFVTNQSSEFVSIREASFKIQKRLF